MYRLRYLLVIVLALAVSATPASAHHLRAGHLAWTTIDLNLRTGPATTYRVITVMPKGSHVQVNSRASSGEWYQVMYGTRTGYALGTYLIGAPRYVFPVQPSSVASYGSCHHDYPASDIFAPIGSRFVAVADGVVYAVGRVDTWDPKVNDPATRSGLYVDIIGRDGVRYHGSHLSKIADGIAPGVHVAAGQLLGLTGRSGNARYTPPHLHFGISHPTYPDDWAVRRGEINPYRYLNKWRSGVYITPDLTVQDGGVC